MIDALLVITLFALALPLLYAYKGWLLRRTFWSAYCLFSVYFIYLSIKIHALPTLSKISNIALTNIKKHFVDSEWVILVLISSFLLVIGLLAWFLTHRTWQNKMVDDLGKDVSNNTTATLNVMASNLSCLTSTISSYLSASRVAATSMTASTIDDILTQLKVLIDNMECLLGQTKRSPPFTEHAVYTTEIENHPFDIRDHLDLTEEDLYHLLAARRQTRFQNKKLEQYLTTEEKQLALEDANSLFKLWKSRRSGKLTRFDDDKLGGLSNEEVNLPRHMVNELIREKRHQQYLANARLAGKILKTCPNCGKLFVDGHNHQCFSLPLGQRGMRKGLPVQEQLMVKSDGKKSFSVTTKPTVDLEEVKKQFDKFREYGIFKQAKDEVLRELRQAPTTKTKTSLSSPTSDQIQGTLRIDLDQGDDVDEDMRDLVEESPRYSPVADTPAEINLIAAGKQIVSAEDMKDLIKATLREACAEYFRD